MGLFSRSNREQPEKPNERPEDRHPRREDEEQDEQRLRDQLSGTARINYDNYDLTMTRLSAAPLFEEVAPLNRHCRWCQRILSEQTRLVSDLPALPDLPENLFPLEERLNLIPTCVAHDERKSAHLTSLEKITYWLNTAHRTSAEIAKQHRYGYLGAMLSGLDPADPACDPANDDLPF